MALELPASQLVRGLTEVGRSYPLLKIGESIDADDMSDSTEGLSPSEYDCCDSESTESIPKETGPQIARAMLRSGVSLHGAVCCLRALGFIAFEDQGRLLKLRVSRRPQKVNADTDIAKFPSVQWQGLLAGAARITLPKGTTVESFHKDLDW